MEKNKTDIRVIYGFWEGMGWGKMKVKYEPNFRENISFVNDITNKLTIINKKLYNKLSK